MVIEVDDDEREFLKESLRYAQQNYEKQAARYLYGDESFPEYRAVYREKMEMFASFQSRLNKRSQG